MIIRNRFMEGSTDGGSGSGSAMAWNPQQVTKYMEEVMASINNAKHRIEDLTTELEGKINNNSLDAAYGGDIQGFWNVWNGVSSFFTDFYNYVKDVDNRVADSASVFARGQEAASGALAGSKE